jgi:iron(III) transport system substrate-binding protein
VPQKLRKIMPVFEKKYGIQVATQTGSSREVAERTLAERRVGRFTMDVWIGGAPTALVYLIPNKAVAPFRDFLVLPEVKDPSLWFLGKHYYADVEGRYVFVWGAAPSYNVVINTTMVKPDEIKSYADLLNPKWKGKIVSYSPAEQGTTNSTTPMFLNPRIGEQWFRRWATEMKPTLVSDARQGAEWVAMGRFPVGMFGLSTQADALEHQGFPIRAALPHPMAEGEVLSASAANMWVLDRAPHPNAAKLFVNWALSREGQSLFIKAGQKIDSLRTDVKNDVIEKQYRIDPKANYIVAFADARSPKEQKDIINKLRQIMKDAGY